MYKDTSFKWQHYILIACAIVMCSLLFWNPRSQSPSWIFPYFSGAANLGLDLAWRVDMSTYKNFESMSYSQQMAYRFLRADPSNLIDYSVLDKGYIFIIWVAQNLLFWLPQIKAVIWLQICFHVLSSLWVLKQLKARHRQIVFVLVYAVNPVVLHFVTFAYHYYWQVIPSLAWFYCESKHANQSSRYVYLVALVLTATFLIRQSTIIVSLFILGYMAWRRKTFASWIVIACFLTFAIIAKNPSQPWHTAYVGIGAYPNNAGIELSDESGYQLFKNKTDIKIDTTPPVGNYYDASVRMQYYQVLKQRLIEYANEHPFELGRNALLNIGQSFSVGYPVGHLGLAYVSSITGLIIMLILIQRQMYARFLMLFTGVAGFVTYYPPIPAYMFGNYLLLSLILTSIMGQIYNSDQARMLGRYLKERLLRLL